MKTVEMYLGVVLIAAMITDLIMWILHPQSGFGIVDVVITVGVAGYAALYWINQKRNNKKRNNKI